MGQLRRTEVFLLKQMTLLSSNVKLLQMEHFSFPLLKDEKTVLGRKMKEEEGKEKAREKGTEREKRNRKMK